VGKEKRQRIVKLIQSHREEWFVRRLSLRVTEWEVPFEGEVFRVLYDKNRKEILTFLPPRKK
jgi:hypothetical protein